MAFQATFGYNNLEAVSDLNLATKVLVKKGVVTGFDVTPVPGTVNVTVSTGYLVSDDGMIVRSTDAETLACVTGQKNHVVFRAVYNSPQDPTLQLEVLTSASLESDPQRSYLVLLAVVDLTASTQTTASTISYNATDRVSVQGRDTFLGPYDNSAQLFSAYPSTAPVKQREGDFALVKSDAQAKPAFYIWIAGAWITLGNYEDLLLQYNLHVSGVIGGGTSVHVTLNEKAAIGGTLGAPGPSNRFVTETDTTRLTTLAQKAAIDNAITGPMPLSATNPLIADGIPVAVPRVVGVSTATTATDTIRVAYGDTGTTQAYFGFPVYVGKLGLDTTQDNKSTARIWFDLQDSFTSGYVDEDGPLYITDILDGSGSSSWSPASDGSVSDRGYWTPSAPSAAIIIKLNRPLASNKTIYVRFYASGTISGLAPQNAYRPPATAKSNALESYREINTARIMNLLSVTAEASDSFISAIGSPANPGFQFRMPGSGDTNGSGLYYLGDVVSSNYAFYNSVAVSAANDTLVVFAKATSGNNTNLTGSQAPLVFEQIADGTTLRYRMHVHSRTPAGLPSIEIGTSAPAGYTSGLRVGQLSAGFFGTQFDADVVMSTGKVFHAALGTNVAPAITFGDDATSGLFAVPSFSSGSMSYFNAVGVSTRGRLAFVFASSTAAADGLVQTSDAPLLFQQYENAGAVGYNIAVVRSGANAAAPDAIRFGATSYTSAFVEWGRFSPSGLTVTGNIGFSGDLQVGGILNVAGRDIIFGADSCVLSGSANSITLSIGSRTPFTYTTGPDKIFFQAAVISTTGRVSVASGTEAVPAYTFTSDTGTGLFYAGDVDTTNGASTRKAVGISIEGSTVVLIGRNEINPGTLTSIQSPLLIEQSTASDGTSSELRLAAMDRSADGSSLVLGVANYVSDFTPYLTIGNNQARFAVPTFFDSTLRAVSGSFTGFVSAASYVHVTASSTAPNAPAFRIGASTGLFGNASLGIVGLSAGGVSVLESSSAGGIHLVLPIDTKVTGKLTANGGADVNGAFTADAVTISGLATFTGAASFSSTLGVTGLTSLSTLAVTGRADFNFGVFSGVISGHYGLTIDGTQPATFFCPLETVGTATFSGGASVAGTLNAPHLVVANAFGAADALFKAAVVFDFDSMGSTTESVLSNVPVTISATGSFTCSGPAVFNGSVTFAGGLSSLSLNTLTATTVNATTVNAGTLTTTTELDVVNLMTANPSTSQIVVNLTRPGALLAMLSENLNTALSVARSGRVGVRALSTAGIETPPTYTDAAIDPVQLISDISGNCTYVNLNDFVLGRLPPRATSEGLLLVVRVKTGNNLSDKRGGILPNVVDESEACILINEHGQNISTVWELGDVTPVVGVQAALYQQNTIILYCSGTAWHVYI